MNHYDIRHEILHQITLCPMSVTLDHVKGHKDDEANSSYEDASLPVHRNVDMDALAKKFLKDPPPRFWPHRRAPMFSQQTVCLLIHDNPIIGNIDHHITIQYLGPKMEQHIHTKNILESQHQGKVNWRAFERAMDRHKT